MRFVFSTRFYILLSLALVPLSFAWRLPMLGYFAVLYDFMLIVFAVVDYRVSRVLADGVRVQRLFDKRFAIGDSSEVTVRFENDTDRTLHLRVKDEYPAEMILSDERETDFALAAGQTADFHYHVQPQRRGSYAFGRTAVRFLSRLGLVWCQAELGEEQSVKVYPNMRRAREMELRALGARSFLAIQRRAVRRGEGREFESMRDYVPGDELRHVSWTATARRGKLTSRQHQIERDQTVLIALDAGRLMTGRIDNESKFDMAVHAALALMSASARAGDNCGIVVFGRRILRYVPPKRGLEHIDAVLEALHDIEPEVVEPSYARAFQFIASNVKKRTFITILTDIVDKDSSKDLIAALKLLRPRHLPLVATVGDRDLNEAVSNKPEQIEDVFAQSAAHEIIHQRESALRIVETLGGMAIDVTGQTLAPKLLESYLRVKERGML
jgi:uncharacterized protein (DUF58 family)